MKRAHNPVSSFVLLVSASLTSGFRLLLSSYGRFFIEFLLSKIADDTVAGAFSLKAAQCAFNVFVFTNFNRRHIFQPSFADAFIFYSVIIAKQEFSVKSFFPLFSTFFENFKSSDKSICRLLLPFYKFSLNSLQGAYTKDK